MTTTDKILAAIDAAFASSPAPPTSGDVAAAVLRALADAQPSAKHWHCDDLRTLASELDGALSQGEQPSAANGELAIAPEAQQLLDLFNSAQHGTAHGLAKVLAQVADNYGDSESWEAVPRDKIISLAKRLTADLPAPYGERT